MNMTPELETLDQLTGGDISLEIILNLYSDGNHFLRGVQGLLKNGDVRLLENGEEVPEWRWRELFSSGSVMKILATATLSLTKQGAKRIG